jgi:hypothetical protein
MSDHEEGPVEPVGEGDRAWRERTQDLDPDPKEIQPPPPPDEERRTAPE